MHLINPILNECYENVHTYALRAEVYADIIEDTYKYIDLYPKKNEYIDFAMENDLREPLNKIIKMTKRINMKLKTKDVVNYTFENLTNNLRCANIATLYAIEQLENIIKINDFISCHSKENIKQAEQEIVKLKDVLFEIERAASGITRFQKKSIKKIKS